MTSEANEHETGELTRQATVFSRYLIGADPPSALVDRYASACRILFPQPLGERETNLLDYVCRHPWATGYLDAAAGLLHPASALRSRIITLAAILETAPTTGNAFLPQPVSALRLFRTLARAGAISAWRIIVGIGLWFWVGRSPR